jgi:hypothetical protein
MGVESCLSGKAGSALLKRPSITSVEACHLQAWAGAHGSEGWKSGQQKGYASVCSARQMYLAKAERGGIMTLPACSGIQLRLSAMTSTAIAAAIAYLMILAAAGGFLLRSVLGGLQLLDKVHNGSPNGRASRR